jgi:hypothetical protein
VKVGVQELFELALALDISPLYLLALWERGQSRRAVAHSPLAD